MMVLCREIAEQQFTLPRVWEGLKQSTDYYARAAAVADFNQKNVWRKRGLSLNPCRCAMCSYVMHHMILLAMEAACREVQAFGTEQA